MRTLLLKILHAFLSLIAIIGALILAFTLAEVYFLLSGHGRPGETIDYFDRPARQYGELGMEAFVSFAVICLAIFVQKRLKRWSASAPHDASLQPTAEEKPKSPESPGSGGG